MTTKNRTYVVPTGPSLGLAETKSGSTDVKFRKDQLQIMENLKIQFEN
jgi:hypothetical protein